MAGLNHVIVPELGITSNPIIQFILLYSEMPVDAWNNWCFYLEPAHEWWDDGVRQINNVN